uniref:Uncharacterized protein n=1 Tax=Setaria italica TaxID=4555 RepID=K3ZPS6_SETIT
MPKRQIYIIPTVTKLAFRCVNKKLLHTHH